MKLREKYKSLPHQKKTAVKILVFMFVFLIAVIPLYFVADCSLKSTRFKSAQNYIVYQSNFNEYYGYVDGFELVDLVEEKGNDVVYMKVNTKSGKIVSCKVTFQKTTVDGAKKEIATWTTYYYTTYADETKISDYYARAKSYIESQNNFKEYHGEITDIQLVDLICEEFTETNAVLMKITTSKGKTLDCKVVFDSEGPNDWSLYQKYFKEN